MKRKAAIILILLLIVSIPISIVLNNSNQPKIEADSENQNKTGPETVLINEFNRSSKPKWIPKSQFSLEDTNSSIIEVTKYPNTEPKPKHYESAWDMYNKSYEAAKENGWFEFEKASDDGYRKFDNIHYKKPDYYLNSENLNPNKPEVLMYYDDPEEGKNNTGKILAGFMYLTDEMDKHGEQFGGPLTVWHYHPWHGASFCFDSNLNNGLNISGYNCSDSDEKWNRSPEMIHVWFMDNPEGPFASRMKLPSDYIEEPEKMSKEEFKQNLAEKYSNFYKQRN